LQKTENDDFEDCCHFVSLSQGFFSFMCPALSLCLQPIAEKVMNLTIIRVYIIDDDDDAIIYPQFF